MSSGRLKRIPASGCRQCCISDSGAEPQLPLREHLPIVPAERRSGQEGMAILVIGCTANRFTQPVLRIVILSEVIIGHARHQRRKMRMEWIKAHLHLGDLNCFGRCSHRVKHLRNAIIRESGI